MKKNNLFIILLTSTVLAVLAIMCFCETKKTVGKVQFYPEIIIKLNKTQFRVGDTMHISLLLSDYSYVDSIGIVPNFFFNHKRVLTIENDKVAKIVHIISRDDMDKQFDGFTHYMSVGIQMPYVKGGDMLLQRRVLFNITK